MPDAKKGSEVKVYRYWLFVGCANPECDESFHTHCHGWDALAAASDYLDELNKACRSIMASTVGVFWWQIVDITSGEVISRSEDLKKEKH